MWGFGPLPACAPGEGCQVYQMAQNSQGETTQNFVGVVYLPRGLCHEEALRLPYPVP
jgi:hypothetical protein